MLITAEFLLGGELVGGELTSWWREGRKPSIPPSLLLS